AVRRISMAGGVKIFFTFREKSGINVLFLVYNVVHGKRSGPASTIQGNVTFNFMAQGMHPISGNSTRE
ncbi:MAG TPA: hypothetical protein PKX28_08470, partial [Candidatus Hydrogenedentes bacterium]|nr:hypothetical protein [Candidatus Hydrogenedentota bacterium]